MPNDSKLDMGAVLARAFDASTDKLRVDAAVTINTAGIATEAKQDSEIVYLGLMESYLSQLSSIVDSVSVGNAASVANVQMMGGLEGSTARFVKVNASGEVQTVSVQQYITAVDEASASVTYVGRAVPGTTGATAAWQISRFTLTGNVLLEATADGNLSFDNVWDNRAILSYS